MSLLPKEQRDLGLGISPRHPLPPPPQSTAPWTRVHTTARGARGRPGRAQPRSSRAPGALAAGRVRVSHLVPGRGGGCVSRSWRAAALQPRSLQQPIGINVRVDQVSGRRLPAGQGPRRQPRSPAPAQGARAPPSPRAHARRCRADGAGARNRAGRPASLELPRPAPRAGSALSGGSHAWPGRRSCSARTKRNVSTFAAPGREAGRGGLGESAGSARAA